MVNVAGRALRAPADKGVKIYLNEEYLILFVKRMNQDEQPYLDDERIIIMIADDDQCQNKVSQMWSE